MCNTLDVSKSGYYDWKKRPPSNRELEDKRLTEVIVEIFNGSRQTYGSPRIYDALKKWEVKCSEERVARLMREAGLVAKKGKRRRPKPPKQESKRKVAPNKLNREFEVDKPNQVWAGDIKYIWTEEGWLYLAVVIDLFSRMVVGWSMAKHMRTSLVEDALKMAYHRRGRPEGVMFHSDQGSQYTSEEYEKWLRRFGMDCSMSRRGNCWDNAVVESFFSTLDAELLWGETFATHQELRQEVFEYVEVFYNRQRIHSTLGYESPENYEKIHEVNVASPSSVTVAFTQEQVMVADDGCSNIVSPETRARA